MEDMQSDLNDMVKKDDDEIEQQRERYIFDDLFIFDFSFVFIVIGGDGILDINSDVFVFLIFQVFILSKDFFIFECSLLKFYY